MSVIERLLLPVFLVAACTTSGSEPTTPANEPTPAPESGPVSEALRAKVCATEETDETSKIFVARNEDGVVTRLIVTPKEFLADAGNSIFDMDGKRLGSDTGGEVPWDDEEFMAKERARVAALMGGATVTEGQTPLPCK